MVMFCFMTKRRINLVRLILDFTLATVNVERRRHATLPYNMFLTRVFIRAQLPLDGHKVDNKHPTTTMETFSVLGLKPYAPEKEREEKKKKDSSVKKTHAQKEKSKPSGEEKKKKRTK